MSTMTLPNTISRKALLAELDISGETLRTWRLSGKMPPPDIDVSKWSQWWRRDTLERAGFRLWAAEEASQPTPEASAA